MGKIFRYSLFDLVRSWWFASYSIFFLLVSSGLILMSHDTSKVVISLLQIILVLIPLMATIFGVMYYYNSREFTELLLAQPIRRSHIFMGQYLGVAGTLILCLWIGLTLPLFIFSRGTLEGLLQFILLGGVGSVLTIIFSGLAFLIALKNENRIKGFGLAILVWLFFAIVYDGLFLLLLSVFSDYPLENPALIGILLNPIDLSRVLILLRLDISALMGYTGAVFQKFFGAGLGSALALISLLGWMILPVFGILHVCRKKDF